MKRLVSDVRYVLELPKPVTEDNAAACLVDVIDDFCREYSQSNFVGTRLSPQILDDVFHQRTTFKKMYSERSNLMLNEPGAGKIFEGYDLEKQVELMDKAIEMYRSYKAHHFNCV